MTKKLSGFILRFGIMPFWVIVLFTTFSQCSYEPPKKEIIQKQFQIRQELAKGREKILFDVFKQNLTKQEKYALEFLYAYMPLSDLAMHTGEYVLKQVKSSFEAKKYFAWGEGIPEDIFYHFVLPYRVNNEYTDTARQVFLKELKTRISGMSMHDAALEVNHWCHEKVVYKGSDERTSGPLTTVRNAQGRCGEESTFTVSALRAVCIPARQVYTPRWAHTDDNHAWVEVWIDGKWYYMGACEPDYDLNMGWFTGPAKRAMMMNTTVFGQYAGTEEVLQKDNLFTKINLLANYAPTKTINVKVVDSNLIPVKGAKVEFMLYNYAEFYPISTKLTDDKGACSSVSGYGDLIIWASQNQNFGFVQAKGDLKDTLVVKISKPDYSTKVESYHLVPPVEQSVPPSDPAKAAINNKRIQKEDSIRNNYVNTFIDSASIAQLAQKKGLKTVDIYSFMVNSRGNWHQIYNYIDNLGEKRLSDGLAILRNISEKDLHDAMATTLNDHLIHLQTFPVAEKNLDNTLYEKYLLAPRIGRELITTWRSYIQNSFSPNEIEEFRTNPVNLVKWINTNIRLDTLNNYYNVPLSPEGVFELKVTDRYSRNLFFVAVCRSIGIPARLETATRKPQFFRNKQWVDVKFEKETTIESPKGIVVLTNESDDKAFTPQYYSHYTIARLDKGQFTTLDYEYDPSLKKFPATIKIDTGYYRLITGNRLNDGSVLCRISYFPLKKDKKIEIPIIVQKTEVKSGVLGKAEIDAKFRLVADNSRKKISDYTTFKGLVVVVIEPDKEPTKHLIEDIKLVKNGFDRWKGNILLVVGKDKLNNAFTLKSYTNLPSNTIFGYDDQNEVTNAIDLMCGINPGAQLPQISIINTNGEIVFYLEGYSIGLGETILKNLPAN